MSLLSITNLSLTFAAAPAVKNISLSIEKGEMLAVVGESGSGKSLTALSCLGLQPAGACVSGSIQFDGQELVGAGESTLRSIRGKRISMIFQEPMTALNPLHTIGKQIGEMICGNNPIIRLSDSQIIDLLEQVGLGHFKTRLGAYPHELSGGERQRVMIAMAIANRPALLIADEPTTAVDVTVQMRILALLKELQRSMNMAILFITHDLTVVRRMADRVAVMNAGEIVEQGKVADIFKNPQHRYTKHLLASEPKGSPVPLPPLERGRIKEGVNAVADPHPEWLKNDIRMSFFEPFSLPLKGGGGIIGCANLKVHFPIRKGFFQRTVYSIKAVDDVTLTIPEGTALGVVGESGSGKTTLGFALLRLIKSDGPIVFLGHNIDNLKIRELRPLRRQMQIVFQDPFSSLNPRMNIRQIIEEGLLVHSPDMSESARETAIDAILKDVGLSPNMKERYPHEFSGGQRQRISIARAMVLKPRFVVLDEPTSALDLSVQSQIIELLKDLQQKYGLSYMFISHDLRVVRAIAHHIIVMRNGKIVEQGDTARIFEHAEHEYTRTLIKAAFMEA